MFGWLVIVHYHVGLDWIVLCCIVLNHMEGVGVGHPSIHANAQYVALRRALELAGGVARLLVNALTHTRPRGKDLKGARI
jgi:hypothetical protein